MKIVKILVVMFLLPLVIQAQTKQNISVLYVGYSPEKEMPVKSTGWHDMERFAAEYQKRMPAFIDHLNRYFNKVGSVDAREYTADMSDNFDVTIFDEVTSVLEKQILERDPKTGKTTKFVPAKFLPDNFDRPSVFIGHTANVLGRTLGSKLDWYCLCLDRHAHHTKFDHEIFKGPYKVRPTIKKRPTPAPIFLFYDGFDMPKEIPMWEVNTEGYQEEKGYRCGLVSRGNSFEDSPNAEVISSGVSDKKKTAVALGRHGNFFLWGFAGSPDYMTAEAKQVFANAIVYTHKHAKDKRIAKKYNERIYTKDFIYWTLHNMKKSTYEKSQELKIEQNNAIIKRQDGVKEKQKRGEELSDVDQMILAFKPIPLESFEQFLAKYMEKKPYLKETGLDTLAIKKYLLGNMDYFYAEPDAFGGLKIDEDCKSLGIANTDIKILDAAISLLEKNKDIEKAERLLWRYTLEDFKTAKEWRTWFKKYKSKMFFTQSGGFVWMINDPDANPDIRPRNDKKEGVKKEEETTTLGLQLDEPTHENPVSVGAMLVEGKNENEKMVLIETNIMSGYHIYAYVPSGEAYIKTELGLDLPEGVDLVGKWNKSSPATYPGKDKILIYKGESSFKQAIKLDGKIAKGTKVKCWLYYQCCDATICFPPKKKEFVLDL